MKFLLIPILVILTSCGSNSGSNSCSETDISRAPDSILTNGNITTYSWGNCTKVYSTNSVSKNVPIITSNSLNKQRVGVFTNVSSLHAIQFNMHGINFPPEQTVTISNNNQILMGINAKKEFPSIGIANIGKFEKEQPILILEGDIIGDIFATDVYMTDWNYKQLNYALEFKVIN